jgi:hypothetical protein
MKGEERERERRKAVSLAPRLEEGAEERRRRGRKNAKTTETHLPWISREERG